MTEGRVPLGDLDDFQDGSATPATYRQGGTEIALVVVRRGSTLVGYVDLCPHMYLPLTYRGRRVLSEDGTRLRCTNHAAEFAVSDHCDVDHDGRCISGHRQTHCRVTTMTAQPFSFWVYLSQSPLLWLTVTLSIYACADAVSPATLRNPLANPVASSTTCSPNRTSVINGRLWCRVDFVQVPRGFRLRHELFYAFVESTLEHQVWFSALLKRCLKRATCEGWRANQNLREQLAALAARGTIDVCRLIGQADGKIGFPETQLTMKVYNSEPAAAAIGQVPNVLALLALLNGPALTALLDKEITAASDDSPSTDARSKTKADGSYQSSD